jgi:hypothetical protein
MYLILLTRSKATKSLFVLAAFYWSTNSIPCYIRFSVLVVIAYLYIGRQQQTKYNDRHNH